MDVGFGLVADPVRKRPWGQRAIAPGMVADALQAAADALMPELAPAMRRTESVPVEIALTLLPLAGPVVLAASPGGRLSVTAQTWALGPGYHAWLVDTLVRIAADNGFAWREETAGDSPLRDETGYFAGRDVGQLQLRFRERMAVRMGELLEVWSQTPEALRFGLPEGLRPAGPEGALYTLRGPRLRVFAELARGGDEDEARALFPWWEPPGADGFGPATALALAEALLWTAFPWRAPLEPGERAAGDAARALINRAGPGEDGEMPVDELETLLAADAAIPPRPDGPGYLRGNVLRLAGDGWTLHVPGFFHALPRDEQGIDGWWFGGREIHVWAPPDGAARPDTGVAGFDAEALLAAADNEIAFIRASSFYSGRIAMHRGPNGAKPELSGEVKSESGNARIWVLFRSAEDSPWVLETFRSLRPPLTPA